jgi:hypothetical protein
VEGIWNCNKFSSSIKLGDFLDSLVTISFSRNNLYGVSNIEEITYYFDRAEM